MYPDVCDIPQTVHALLDHAQDKIVVVDERGVYRFANDATERILGYTPEEFVGRNVLDEVHPDDRDRVRSAFDAVVADPEEVVDGIEFRHRAVDGSWVWLESRMRNDPVAELDGYVVSSRDVTARKRAELRQHEIEARLEELAANTEDALWLYSGDWREALFVNDAYEEIWGQSIEQLRENPLLFMEGVHPDDRSTVREAMERLSDGESVDIEFRTNPEREFRRWAWVKAQPIVEDGEVERIVGFTRDITNRRRRERQLRVMDTLLRHNLRNDMNVILGHAELCARDAAEEGVTDHMDVILQTGRDLLETAEKEREIVDLLVDIGAPGSVDLRATVSEVTAATAEAYPEATVQVDVADFDAAAGGAADGDTTEVDDRPDGAFSVRALPEIGRALEELLENAIEHAESDPAVSVELRPSGAGVELVLRDNAPPIPGNEYEPLFGDGEPSAVYHATGLGLWLVYWIVDLSEGDIEFQSEPGGNEITIWLPAVDD